MASRRMRVSSSMISPRSSVLGPRLGRTEDRLYYQRRRGIPGRLRVGPTRVVGQTEDRGPRTEDRGPRTDVLPAQADTRRDHNRIERQFLRRAGRAGIGLVLDVLTVDRDREHLSDADVHTGVRIPGGLVIDLYAADAGEIEIRAGEILR